ncbi:hypothetical protein SO802_022265 [Lithocarpus litseifolius]|uniref:Uncharacterized protein n=1 Tax=Lithocarpus litseifolius TaxID=425828 RepID=A0AAW2CLJ0_9ROSI
MPTQPSIPPLNLNPPKLQPSPTSTIHSSQTKPSPSLGEREKSFFRIDSKAFFLSFDGGRMDSYSIIEKRGRYHGSIRVGRLGLDWIIACLVELCRWDFSKQQFFKRFHENYKILECSSRLNKGGFFVEFSEYHNGARRGCLRVPEGFRKGGWAFLERKLRDFFLGKLVSRPGKEVAAGGGRFVKPTGNPRNHVWKAINGHVKLGSDLDLNRQFPKLAGTLNQKERFGGFDFIPNANFSTHVVSGRPMRASSFKWTKAHFSLNISVDLAGKGQRVVKWGTFVPPKPVKAVSAPNEFGPVQQANGGPLKQAQDDLVAITKHNQTGDSYHLESQVLSRSCERGEGSGSHACAEKMALVSGEKRGVLSTSDGGSEKGMHEFSVPMGYPGSGAEVGVPSTASVADDQVTDCPISGVVGVLTSDGLPSFTVTVNPADEECSTLRVESAEVSCHQPLLVKNRFAPFSELVSDSSADEMLMLNWVHPTGSDKDEEDRQLMAHVPLAQWDPNGGLLLLTEDGDPIDISVEEDVEPSAWMLVILHPQLEVYFNMLIFQHFPIKGVLKHKMVTIILDAPDYANIHRIDPNHLQISIYAGDFNTLLNYEVTFVLDALDQVDIQRIVPNCLHIRYSYMSGWVYGHSNGANIRKCQRAVEN